MNRNEKNGIRSHHLVRNQPKSSKKEAETKTDRQKTYEKLELGNADLANEPVSNFDHFFSFGFFVFLVIFSNSCLCLELKMGLRTSEEATKKG